ncbi:MAG: hypothetical protein V5B30_16015 [Candidatus Accumulibacter delftensis]
MATDSETPSGQLRSRAFQRHEARHSFPLAVLAHEDHAEFSDLLAALTDEHQPAGMTERHLIEELATIIWRKRRVLMAEGARINEGLKSTLSSPKSVMPSAAPFQRGLSGENTDLRDLFDSTPEDNAESLKSAELDLAAGQKAAAILRKGGANAYEKARRALIPESRDWWDEHVADEEHPATAEGLAEFIRDSLEPICYRMVQEARFTPRSRRKPWAKGCERTCWRS